MFNKIKNAAFIAFWLCVSVEKVLVRGRFVKFFKILQTFMSIQFTWVRDRDNSRVLPLHSTLLTSTLEYLSRVLSLYNLHVRR